MTTPTKRARAATMLRPLATPMALPQTPDDVYLLRPSEVGRRSDDADL